MHNLLRRSYRSAVAPLLRTLVSPLFARRYLRGRYFDDSYAGWFQVWRAVWVQKLLGFNRHVPWPVSPFIAIDCPHEIDFDPDDMHNFWHFGCYYANYGGGRITIGKGTWIAPNVGIITTNHDTADPGKHLPAKDVIIGRNCWIGMNSVVLPGVRLGDHTVVAAGSVVCRSFPGGHCVLAGVPAMRTKLTDDLSTQARYDPPLFQTAASGAGEHEAGEASVTGVAPLADGGAASPPAGPADSSI
jgi:acetyltransferase-like isoleucine patch superfamily enzyme